MMLASYILYDPFFMDIFIIIIKCLNRNVSENFLNLKPNNILPA